jgi:hypothetical protein
MSYLISDLVNTFMAQAVEELNKALPTIINVNLPEFIEGKLKERIDKLGLNISKNGDYEIDFDGLCKLTETNVKYFDLVLDKEHLFTPKQRRKYQKPKLKMPEYKNQTQLFNAK